MTSNILARAAALACAALTLIPQAARACDDCDCEDPPPPVKLALVRVQAAAPSSLPTNIPATRESVTREDIERSINATDAEDALKYLPSLLVRKRYIGDYNHAILSSRASGTGNSARSAVYADGILLSNYLGNGVGGLSFPPRWGLVTPEEIERVDVMYGPFSAAYPGNSAGAVVDYQTRMPTRFEAHAKLGHTEQPFDLYGHKATYRAWVASASLGDRAGAFSWWFNVNRTHSEGQPLTFATRLAGSATDGAAGTPVTGAVAGLNSANQPWLLIGAGTQYDTRQDHLKLKLAYDLSTTLRASYVLGTWRNDAEGNSASWLRDADGSPVYRGAADPVTKKEYLLIDGRQYAGPTGGDFALTRERLLHLMHGVSVKSRSGGEWDWEFAASRYDYRRDDKRQNAAANPQPAARSGGAGTLADGGGTGWHTLALKGVWRPAGTGHVVDLGLQQDGYRLRYLTSAIAGNYLADPPGALAANVSGDTRLQSAHVQDAWLPAPGWKAVLGLRAETWAARNGRTDFSATASQRYAARTEHALSPKAALSWQASEDTLLKLAIGRAVRMPTVAELYGATATANSQYINDPDLRPEKSWTAELGAEQAWGPLRSRLTWFAEDVRDSLYSQTLFDAAANRNISRVQNIARIGSTGLEATLGAIDWPARGLDLSASATYTDSKIKANAGFVAAPGDTLGQWQPNIPRWRATLLATWRLDARWSASLAARYSGRQYRTLNNADVNGAAYMGVSRYATADLRLLWKITRQWSAALGIDNLNNAKYWNFHPYPQRSTTAELKFDL